MSNFKKCLFVLVFIFMIFLTSFKLGDEREVVKANNTNIEIESYNLSYKDSIHLLVAVNCNEFDVSTYQVKVLFFDQEMTEYTVSNAKYVSSSLGTQIVNNKLCYVYSSYGIAAKNLNDLVYFCSYVVIDDVEYYGNIISYSVKQYVNDRISSDNYTSEQLALYNALIEYGNCAKELLSNPTNNSSNLSTKTLEGFETECFYNLSYSESIYIVVAVNSLFDTSVYPVKMLFWTELPTEFKIDTASYETSTVGTQTVNGKVCDIYYSQGIAAKEMTDYIYMCTYVNVDGTEYYGEVKKYSVLTYVNEKVADLDCSTLQLNLYQAMLNYGSCAQILFNYHTDLLANATYYNVSLVNGKLSDGFTSGLYQHGDKVKLTADSKTGGEFTHWIDETGEVVSKDASFEIEVSANKTYTAVYTYTIDIILNTSKVTASSRNNDAWYTVSAKNSSNLLYIITTITIVDEEYKDSIYKLVVNNKEIVVSKYTISDNVITYKIDDPNWSEYL